MTDPRLLDVETLAEALFQSQVERRGPDGMGLGSHEADAAAIWAALEEQPGFNERVAEGRAQLAAGQRVPFAGWLSMEPDRANLELRPDDEPAPPPPRWPGLVVAFCAGVLALAVVLVVAR